MKKVLKILLTTLINISIIFGLILISDFTLYQFFKKDFIKYSNELIHIPKFSYITEPFYGINLSNYFDGSDNKYKGRKPDGLEYKNETPIVIFGCSYAHGQYLNQNQTFSYKLSKILKRPVYNRAIPGKGFQTMYYQVSNPVFYRDVPKSNEIIYVMINDHYRRMMSRFINPIDLHFAGKYYIDSTNSISEINYDNKLISIFLSSYTVKWIYAKYVDYFINNEKNAEKLANDAVIYLTETRLKLEQKWGNKIEFIIVLYDNIPIKNKLLLQKKLEENNFVVIVTSELTDENLNSTKYIMKDNNHPTEETWDLLVPKIIETLRL